MPFVDDLEQELRRAAAARERAPRRWWSLPGALPPAAALAAVLAALVVAGAFTPAPDLEESVDGNGPQSAPRLIGAYETTVRDSPEWNGVWELLVRGGNARVLGMIDGVHVSLLAGKLTFRGDEVTFRVDLVNGRNDPWPEPICARQRRDTPGTYRIVWRTDGAFELRRLRDPCEGRAAILTSGAWRRPVDSGP